MAVTPYQELPTDNLHLSPQPIKAELHDGDKFSGFTKGPVVYLNEATSAVLATNNKSKSRGVLAGSIDNIPDVGVGGRSDAKGNAGVYGYSENGTGVQCKSASNEALHAETHSSDTAAIAAHQMNPDSNTAALFARHEGGGPAAFFQGSVIARSESGEAIHAETNSTLTAAIAAIQTKRDSKTAALFARHEGGGPAAVFQGNVHVSGDVLLTNADIAEDFTVADEEVEAGTVMIFDKEGLLVPCSSPYDKKVVGVISGAGQYKPGMILDKQDDLKNRYPIALMGKVYCKVDANISPIEIGDLLTTSPTNGCAMKAVDPYQSFGTVIGKALKPLHSGYGLIPILVTLQ